MKRCLSIALALVFMCTPLATCAESSACLTICVFDEQGNPLQGAQVTIKGGSGTLIEEYTIGETGTIEIQTLPDGMYEVQAIDPIDGHTDTKRFNHFGETRVNLVIRKLKVGSELIVGTLTQPTGNFFTDMWGNNSTNADVRALLHGYATLAWTHDASYAPDQRVLTSIKGILDAGGNKTYTLIFAEDLVYNDGTPITARDYAFSILLQCAPQCIELGAMAYVYEALVGFTAFNSGATDVFSGVRVINDYTLSLTIATDHLPNFYELNYINVLPYPIHVIAPGMTIADDGAGAYISPMLDEAGNPLGEFTVAVLKDTILDPETGHLTNPAVTSGPYQLEYYDSVTSTVSFTANRLYRGNYEGRKPTIDKLVLRQVSSATMLDELGSGSINIINKISERAIVDDALERQAKGRLNLSVYLRSGLAFIGFACEEGATQFMNVREAVALCLDKDAFVRDFIGEYGERVYSFYGLGQWMATDHINEMSEILTTYGYSTERALALLLLDGWTLNEAGEPFNPATDFVRYKRVDSELMPLQLNYAKVRQNDAAQLVEDRIADNLRSIGFELNVMEMTFEEMLSYYYRTQERTYNMFYLGTNFTHVFDPYKAFSPDPRYQGALNTSGIADAKLMELAQILRETEPGNTQMYTERWLALMRRYSDLLPAIPLYSNIYFDAFYNYLHDYEPNTHWSWTAAILYAYQGEELVLD